MAENIFNETLTHSMDWGDVNGDGSGLQASGKSVQTYIKGPLIDSRIGYLHSREDQESNQNVLYGFASKAKFDIWVQNGSKDDDELILSKTQLAKAEPQPYYYFSLRSDLEIVDGSANYISIDDTVKLNLIFIAQYYGSDGAGGLTPETQSVVGNVAMEIWDASLTAWRAADLSQVNTKIESTFDGSATEVDLTKAFASSGQYRIRLRVTGQYTDANGDDNNFATPWIQYNVTKTSITFSLATPWYQPIYASGSGAYKYLNLDYHITGAVDKTLVIKISGAGGSTPRTHAISLSSKENYPSTGSSKTIKIEDNYNDNSLYRVTNNGIHNIESYVIAYHNGVQLQETEHLFTRVYVNSNINDNNTYVTLNNISRTLTNWATNKLFDYAICGKGDLDNVSLQLKAAEGDNIYAEQQLSIQKETPLSCTLSLDIDTQEETFPATANIYNNGVSLYSNVFVIDNSAGYSPYDGADFIFNPKKYNNNTFEGIASENKYIINESTKATDRKNIQVELNGFEFANDGFIEDEDGNRCFRILGGQQMNIKGFLPFKQSNGELIKNNCVIDLAFAFRNINSIPNEEGISDENRSLININNKNNSNQDTWDGLEVMPYIGLFKTMNTRVDLAQDVWLAGDQLINLIISITADNYGNGQVAFYINGILNRIFAIENETGLWGRLQDTTIVIGDNNAKTDIDIYSIRVYKDNTSINNNYNNLLKNYISSLPTVEEKNAVKLANDIVRETTEGVNYINYNRCHELGYNNLVWKPLSEPYAKDYGDSTQTKKTFTVVGLAHGSNEDTQIAGDLEIRIYKENSDGTRELDKFKSGTIKNLRVKGQGTSSMGYWKWNQRWEFNKLKVKDGTIVTEGKDEYLEIQIADGSLVRLKKDEDYEDDDGTLVVISKFYPMILDDPEITEEQRDEYRAKYVKSAYQLEDGDPWAQRLDAKINWASPMQSHKLGSVNLYHDIWTRVVGGNDITKYNDSKGNGASFTGTPGGYRSCRVSIRQKPFMLFQHKDPNDHSETAKEFYGLFTMGPSKGDKPTFGYNKKDFPDYVMMEGMDNGALLAICEIPWNDLDIRPDRDFEYYLYDCEKKKPTDPGFKGAWEVSMGKKKKESVINLTKAKSNPIIHRFKEMINFCYNCKINVVGFNGSFDEFDGYYKNPPENVNWATLTSDGDSINTNNLYWMNKGSNENRKYDLYRCESRMGAKFAKWVPAGVNYKSGISEPDLTSYESYNIYDNGDNILKERLDDMVNYSTLKSKNDEVIKFRVRRYKGQTDSSSTTSIGHDLVIQNTIGGIGEYVNLADLLFTLQMLKLIGASDNWAKNTYIVNPGIYEPDMSGKIVRTHEKHDDPNKVGKLVKVGDSVKQFGMARFASKDEEGDDTIQKYKLVSKFSFFQDDLDTIFSLENTGQKVKQYYMDENDYNSNGSKYWNASNNPLFKLAYCAWDDHQYQYNDANINDNTVMYMSQMMKSILASMNDLGANSIGEDRVLHCWDKYYGAVTKYIPAYAYNEIARLLYEEAHYAKIDKRYTHSIEPYTQCVGDQYLSEKEWFRKRSILFSSYAQYGMFSAADKVTSEGALVYRSYALHQYGVEKPSYKYKVAYNQYIWPSAGIGTSSVEPEVKKRYAPGEEVVLGFGSTDGNTNVFIRGINYIHHLSDFGGTIVDPNVAFVMAGDKLDKFIATEEGTADIYGPNESGQSTTHWQTLQNHLLFTPASISFNGMKSLREIKILGASKTGNKIKGSINLSDHRITIKEDNKEVQKNIAGSRNVEKIDVTGTNISSLILPSPNVVTELKLPDSIASIDLTGSKKLTNNNLFVNSYDNITSVTIGDCPAFDEFKFLNDNFISPGRTLGSLTLRNLNWTGGKKIDVSVFQKIMNISSLTLTGSIELSGEVDFNLKSNMISKFGNVDNTKNGLHVKYNIISGSTYNQTPTISGVSNIWKNGSYKFTVNYLSYNLQPANDFYNVIWSLSNGGDFCSIDNQGVLTVTSVPGPNESQSIQINCIIQRYKIVDGVMTDTTENISAEAHTISFVQPLAKVGDYVYADGTYGSPSQKIDNKTIIGVCIYADRNATTGDKQNKIAASTEIIKCSNRKDDVQTCAYYPIWGRSTIDLYTSPNKTNGILYNSTDAPTNRGKKFIDGDIITNDVINCTVLHPMPSTQSNWWDNSNGMELPDIIVGYHGENYNESNKAVLCDFGFAKYGELNEDFCAGKYNTYHVLNSVIPSVRQVIPALTRPSDWNVSNLPDELKGARNSFEFFNYIMAGASPNKVSTYYGDYSESGSGLIKGDVVTSKSHYVSNYYPAFTYCSLYQPFEFNSANKNSAGEELHENFREGKWFLPSAGELVRILSYIKVTSLHDRVNNMFLPYENGSYTTNVFSNGYIESFGLLRNAINQNTPNADTGMNGDKLFWSSTSSTTSSSHHSSSSDLEYKYAYCLGIDASNYIRMYGEILDRGAQTHNFGIKYYKYNLWPCVQF